MGALPPDVSRIQNDGPRELMLDIEAPCLFLRRLIQIANRNSAYTLTEHRQCSLAAACGLLDSEGKGIPQKLERQPRRRRDIIDTIRDRIVSEEPAGDGIPDDADIGRIVIDAVSASESCTAQDLVCKAEPWSHLAPISIKFRSRSAVLPSECHSTSEIETRDCDRGR